MSMKKVTHFARMIRRMHVDDALAQCQVSPKKAGQICSKVTSALGSCCDGGLAIFGQGILMAGSWYPYS